MVNLSLLLSPVNDLIISIVYSIMLRVQFSFLVLKNWEFSRIRERRDILNSPQIQIPLNEVLHNHFPLINSGLSLEWVLCFLLAKVRYCLLYTSVVPQGPCLAGSILRVFLETGASFQYSELHLDNLKSEPEFL